TVRRTGDTAQPLTVQFSVDGTYAENGSATYSVDYPAIPQMITIPAGLREKSFDIVPVNDTQVEPTETVIATLVPQAGYIVGNQASDTVLIIDNDTRVTVSASQPNAAEQGPVAGAFTFSREGYTAEDLKVYFSVYNDPEFGVATEVSDYERLPRNIVIPAN